MFQKYLDKKRKIIIAKRKFVGMFVRNNEKKTIKKYLEHKIIVP